jgi:hypothetical protein
MSIRNVVAVGDDQEWKITVEEVLKEILAALRDEGVNIRG